MRTDSIFEKHLSFCLLFLRLGIAVVFVMWTLDKFLNPEHAKAVFTKFYGVTSSSDLLFYIVGGLQSLLLLAFISGAFKSVSYLGVLLMHAVSTLSSFKQYLDPWAYPYLLFFAAIPMLAVCLLLWRFRNYDRLFSVDAARDQSGLPKLNVQLKSKER